MFTGCDDVLISKMGVPDAAHLLRRSLGLKIEFLTSARVTRRVSVLR
jgi:hypothetical protein